MGTKNKNSSSYEQVEIENIARAFLVDILQVDLNFSTLNLPNANGTKFQVDFYNLESLIFGEIYAGIDMIKSGQKRKVGMDILKLLTIEKLIGKPIVKYIAFTDEAILKRFVSKSWYSKSIEVFDIKVILIPLTQDQKEILRKAKKRQFR